MISRFEHINALSDKREWTAIIKVIKTLRVESSERIASLMKERKYSLTFMAKQINVDKGGLCKQLKAGHMISLQPEPLQILAYEFLSSTCQELLFGEKRVAILAKTITSIVQMLESFSNEQREELLAKADEIYRHVENTGTLKTYQTPAETIHKRIREIAADKDLSITEVCGKNVHPSVKESLRKYMRDSEYVCQNNMLMYMSLVFNQPIDYLVTWDYVSHCDIAYHNEEGDVEIITDETMRQFVRRYTFLPEDAQKEIFTSVMREYMCL